MPVSRSAPVKVALLDQPDDEGFMRIEAGGAAAALRAWRQFADLRPRNTADRAGHSHAEPRHRLPRRHALSEAFKTRDRSSPLNALPIVHLHPGGC
ncbi:hypothetical protein X743_33345 [Mesorhizobium sp. LNHC252B00]|nr:hypothetical protein X743_33345 [Mesorhizobium sp. LNHC252B00]